MLLAAPALAAPGEDADVRRTESSCVVREVVGPGDIPLPRALTAELLDRPDLCAFLARRHGLAPYTARVLGPGLWRGDDGRGTTGTARLVENAPSRRVYYAEGEHRSSAFPTVRARVVVELYLVERPVPGGRGFTRATARVCVSPESAWAAGAAKVLRPFVRAVVRHKFTRALSVAARVGRVAADAPDVFAADLAAFPDMTPAQKARLLAALRSRL